MDTRYVSEYAHFMDGYLHDHPEVVEDQHVGFDIYWKSQGEVLPVPDNIAALRAEPGPHESLLTRLLHATERSIA